MDVVEAARVYLAADVGLKAKLGNGGGWDTWIFQWSLYEPVESSSQCALVLKHAGSWTSPNRHNTARFPRLLVEIYADPSRDADENYTKPDAEQKVLDVFSVLDSLLHKPYGYEADWGDLHVIGSIRLDEAEPLPWPDVDQGAVGRAYYGITHV